MDRNDIAQENIDPFSAPHLVRTENLEPHSFAPDAGRFEEECHHLWSGLMGRCGSCSSCVDESVHGLTMDLQEKISNAHRDAPSRTLPGEAFVSGDTALLGIRIAILVRHPSPRRSLFKERVKVVSLLALRWI